MTGARIRCYLLGCVTDTNPGCVRCNADLYDFEFVQIGKLEPLFNLYWGTIRALRRLGPKRCAECRKKFWRGYDDQLCSEECFNEWLPF